MHGRRSTTTQLYNKLPEEISLDEIVEHAHLSHNPTIQG